VTPAPPDPAPDLDLERIERWSRTAERKGACVQIPPAMVHALVARARRAEELEREQEDALEYIATLECEDPPTLDNWTCQGCWPCSAKAELAKRKSESAQQGAQRDG